MNALIPCKYSLSIVLSNILPKFLQHFDAAGVVENLVAAW